LNPPKSVSRDGISWLYVTIKTLKREKWESRIEDRSEDSPKSLTKSHDSGSVV